MATQFFLRISDTPVPLVATLINVDGTYNPTSNTTSVDIYIVGRGRRLLQTTATITNPTTSEVSYTFSQSDLTTIGLGTFNVQYIVTYVGGLVVSYPNDGEQLQVVITQ